ncbi:MAG: alpha/beta fold hydrolase [Deltaproteobacteria bacterium]|nr:alpha/beta fold hydrolase [Deltaproteobacteria bacterium]
MSAIIKDSVFFVKGDGLVGRFFLPPKKKRPPVVVMGHGFGAEMAFGLAPFAERFVKKGLAVFMFDYRGFGESAGMPRNLVHPFRHLVDWKAALAHVRQSGLVNSERLGIWGSSFAGGHVVVTAAKDRGVKAVVSQIPFLDGVASANERGLVFGLRAALAGVLDLASQAVAGEPLYVPIVGGTGAIAPLAMPGNLDSYLGLIPEERRTAWGNRCPARIFLLTALYRPIKYAPKVKCPALVVMAEEDNLIPASLVEKAASLMPKGRLMRLPVDHFAPYSGEPFEKVVTAEADFFAEVL